MPRPRKESGVNPDALQVVESLKSSKDTPLPTIDDAFDVLCSALEAALEDDEPALAGIDRARELYGEEDGNSWSTVINLLQGVVGKTFLTN